MKHLKQFFNTSTHPSTIRLFSIVISLWVVFNTLTLLPAHENFWSPNSFIPLHDWSTLSFFEKPFHLLSLSVLSDTYLVFVGIQLIASFFVIANIYPLFSQILVTWATLNLDNRAHAILDGGNNLIHLFLLYLPFLLLSTKVSSLFKNTRIFISNYAFLICRLQLVTVYLCAGFSKITGDLWPQGVALYYTMNVREYGHPLIAQLFDQSNLILVFATYATVIFQVSFPFLIWNRTLRPLYLAGGTLLHLGIAFGMGLTSFGFAMCASYFIFYTDNRAEKVLQQIRLFLNPPVLTVAFDEKCKTCQIFARFILLLDWQKKIKIDKARKPESHKLIKISLQTRIATIHSFVDQQTFTGFQTIRLILFRVPIFRIFDVLMLLLDKSNLGEIFYKRFFSHSQWRKNCAENLCSLEEVHS